MVQPQPSSAAPAHDPQSSPVVWFGSFRFDLAELLLYRGDVEVPLPPRALAVLAHLVSRPGKLVSKQLLLDALWKDASVTETSLIEAISVVRQALGDDAQQPTYIQTVHRRGYRFVSPVSTRPLEEDPTPEVEVVAEPSAAPPTGHGHSVVPAVPHRHGTSWLIPIGLLAGIVLSLAAAYWSLARPARSSRPRPVTRAVISLVPPEAPAATMQPSMALSSDGVRLVYVGGDEDERCLYLRAMSEFTATPIRGTEGAYGPFFSHDGEWVGFFADGALKKVPVRGGVPQVLARAPAGHGASWGRDGTIVFAADATGGLQRISGAGGPALSFTRVNRSAGETSHRWPEVLPDGKAVIVTTWRTSLSDARVSAFSIDSGAEIVLSEEGSCARYAPTGHLVFGGAGELLAVPFDPSTMRITGSPVAIARDAVTDASTGASHFTFSDTGTLVYLSVEGQHATVNLVMEWFAELSRLVPPSGLFRPVSSRAALQ